MMRLDRFLCGQTVLSRKEADAAVRKGRVTVGGVTVRKPDMQISPETDAVTLDGSAVEYQQFRYIMLHKPAGVLTAARDKSQKTVLDLLPPDDRRKGIAPCGRLDKDTSGLLLLTDDGQLSHRLISPKHHAAKYYLARLAEPFDSAYIPLFRAGIRLRDGDSEEQCLPAECEQIDSHTAVLELFEGKYHQVRRMFAAAGNHVENLLRVQVGSLKLPPELPAGGSLHIFNKEIELMLNNSSVSEAAEFCRQNYSSYWIKETT